MTAILGISAFYHDSAAALVIDGKIVAAAQEERFTRKKHDERFPEKAVEYCLKHAGITAAQLDLVAFYEKPLVKFDRLLETYLSYVPAGFKSFLKAMPLWLKQKLRLPAIMRKALPGYTRRFVFLGHHESHAASAFLPSPFEKAAILTLDGVGEWSTATIGVGEGNSVKLTHELRFPHSIGLLYSAFTYYCGFKVNSGEYKLMGLAPYGDPKFYDTIMSMIDLKEDGSFRLDMRYFNYCAGLTMTNARFDALFGKPVRAREAAMDQHYMDVAASIQKVTEEIMLRMARHAHKVTEQENLCLAGGVALNCVANGRILREGPFKKIWIQPASGDAGSALGAALFTWHHLLGNARTPATPDAQYGSLLGPSFGDEETAAFFAGADAVFEHFDDEARLVEHVADVLASEKVVGWFNGRMEFGPRALGSRSIIGDARSAAMQTTMNVKIKFRESFRPFAPVVLREHSHEYFEMAPDVESPYMLLVAPVAEKYRLAQSDIKPNGLERLKQIRSTIPAITHVDYSARVQTVDETRHGRFHKLMRAFEARTGCPVMINTSFNVRGEPIVCTPSDAWRCFMSTNMDVLVVGNYVLHKSKQKNVLTEKQMLDLVAAFEPD
ncbi:MAG: carbamoyltransferase [Planctomycetes bacterium]|nr:carbamoyltransferase [Planctomycetota bacterium]